jgi:hypothetical protein
MDQTLETVEFLVRSGHSVATAYLRPMGGVRTVQGGNDLPIRFKNMLATSGPSDHESAVSGLQEDIVPPCPLRIL